MLMNADYRRECVKKLPPKALKRIILPDLDRQYTLYEIAIITSAGPARALGLTRKGHLGIGADADVSLYHENPDGESMFRYPRYVIKDGEVVVEDGDIRKMTEGREFLFRPAYDERIEDYLRPLFQQVYTMSFDNYPVELSRIPHPEIHGDTSAKKNA
jgi:formylmethanofuran dehydrogenase subunit A